MREGSPEPTRPRCVWLNDDLCGFIYTALAHSYPRDIAKADEFHARWKAAPENATDRIANELLRQLRARYKDVQIADPAATMIVLRRDAAEIVAALGGSQETTT